MNATSEDSLETGTTRIVTTTIYAILGSIGIIGNSLVLIVMITVKDLRTITNLFITNQSVIDLISSVLLFFTYIAPPAPIPKSRWVGSIVCKMWNSKYIFWSTIVASTYNLVVLAVERYFAVLHPVTYRNKFTYRRSAVALVAPWAIGFGDLAHWAVLNQYSHGQCVVRDYGSSVVQAFIGCLTLVIEFVIPLTVMTVVYVRIGKSLRQRVHNVQLPSTTGYRTEDTMQQQRQAPEIPDYRERARRNVIKTLLIVCITYAICWTPNQIIYLYYNFGGPIDFDGTLFYFTVYFAFGNMCVNPLIYALKYRKFQRGLKKLFRSGS